MFHVVYTSFYLSELYQPRIMDWFVPRSNAEQILQSYNIILFVLNKYKFYLN